MIDCDGRVELGLLRRVVDLAGQLVQHLGVLQLAGQQVELVDVGLDVGVLGVDLLGLVLVVPQVGAADLVLELDQPRPVGVDLEVAVRLAETAAQLFQIVGIVTHVVVWEATRSRRDTS